MARPLPWTVFRDVLTPDGIDFEPIGTVRAQTQSEAVFRARQIDGAPLHPVVAHAHQPGVLAAEEFERPYARRSRRNLGRAA